MSVAYEHAGRPWSVEEVLALPEDENRYEVVDGALIVSPPPNRKHQRVSFRLGALLEEAARAAGMPVQVWEAVGLRLSDNRMTIPDLVVAHGDVAEDGVTLEPHELLLVAEVVSPGSTALDRSTKPYLYAEAGIPYFWRIELAQFKGNTQELPALLAYELTADGEYRLVAEVGAGKTAELDRPVRMSFDPSVLVR